jgi:DNA-directed RNA polymerase alpha subunit
MYFVTDDGNTILKVDMDTIEEFRCESKHGKSYIYAIGRSVHGEKILEVITELEFDSSTVSDSVWKWIKKEANTELEYQDIFISVSKLRRYRKYIPMDLDVTYVEKLKKSIWDIHLSTRAIVCLRNLDIHTVGDLIKKTDVELLKSRNFGVITLNEVKTVLARMDLGLKIKS